MAKNLLHGITNRAAAHPCGFALYKRAAIKVSSGQHTHSAIFGIIRIDTLWLFIDFVTILS
jgi:hypothetical protein